MRSYISKTADSVSLAIFRLSFGFLMCYNMFRAWAYGWIEQLYIKPKFFFSYYGFEFVKPLGNYTYIIFAICTLSAIFVLIGYKYRIAIITLFLSFTYIELMDKTYYINHYYLLTLLSFLMCFLPANVYFSVDAYLNKDVRKQYIPKFTIDAIKLMIGIVYFYAGLAKLNSDWLFRASPLNIWLPSKSHFYLVGDFMNETWLHYGMSWAGALYDLSIPFLLLYKPTRKIAFGLVVVFHVLTRILFPIGMFPHIMILSTIIFFDAKIHHKIISFIANIFKINKTIFDTQKTIQKINFQGFIVSTLVLFFVIQVLFPFRYLLYPSELFWKEEGYRFSWRVMLTEKAGVAEFKIVDKDTNKSYYIDNKDYLEPYQEKQMSFHYDIILEYAHYLGDIYKQKGIKNPAVYVDNYVTLNGRLSKTFVKPTVDLYQQKDGFKPKNWIESFKH